jgi:LppP/LprE lipoprotein
MSTSATASTTTAASTTGATSTTRTETAPAFVGTTPTSGAAVGHDLAAAIAVLSHHGYVPVTSATYNADDTLRVLIGRRTSTAGERAFFFDQTIYLGTDASTPSAQITLADENDTEVTLNYGIYRPGASAAGGERPVRFVLDMGQLSAMDPLPSVAQRR